MIRRFFKWIFKKELEILNKELETIEIKIRDMNRCIEEFERYKHTFDNLLSNIDVSADVHEYHHYARSWAVISIQGKGSDFIKFVDLGSAEIDYIRNFLQQFDRDKIDASPRATKFLRVGRNYE